MCHEHSFSSHSFVIRFKETSHFVKYHVTDFINVISNEYGIREVLSMVWNKTIARVARVAVKADGERLNASRKPYFIGAISERQ